MISVIYGIEYDQNRWEELIPILSASMTKSDPDVRKAAIIALKGVCEAVHSKILDMHTVNLIMTAILRGMQEKIIAQETLKALSEILKPAKEFLKNSVRGKILRVYNS